MLSDIKQVWRRLEDRYYFHVSIQNKIHCVFTTRLGGSSEGAFNGLNLAQHVGDDSQAVECNRRLVAQDWRLPSQVFWLNQTHSVKLVPWQEAQCAIEADASYSQQANQVCGVMTADCIPLLAVSADGNTVAAIHAGWRGLADGIVENTLMKLGAGSIVVIGPHIQQSNFQVGAEVRQIFIEKDAAFTKHFINDGTGKYLADIGAICRAIISNMQCSIIEAPLSCTFEDSEHFYSYRRDGQTGRMASLIWRT